MKIGFTGSRRGMTADQENAVTHLFADSGATELHHGDCYGADLQANDLAVHYDMRIILHPPDDPKGRAFCASHESREQKPYLDRNHDIVDETDILIACPNTTKEVQRSGTWATIRYAERKKKDILLIYPSGRIFKISKGFGRKS
jgi:hypothetical protein